MRSKASVLGLCAVLSATIVALASCGQPVPFMSMPLGEAIGLGRVLPAPPTPLSLSASANGSDQRLEPGSWTNAQQLLLSVDASKAASNQLMVEAEFLPEQQPFSGIPNISGHPGASTVTSPEMQPGEQYHWALRMRSMFGPASAWVRYPGTIGYEPSPPPAPALQALPRDGWAGSRQLQLTWQADGNAAGIAGFAYSLDRAANGNPEPRVNTTDRSAQVTANADGDWFFHLRTIDRAGNASEVSTQAIHVDSVPLSLEQPKYEADTVINPAVSPLSVQLKANKPAKLALAIYPESGDTPLRTIQAGEKAEATVQWDGKNDAGQPLPRGKYRLRFEATDKTGRTAEVTVADPIPMTNKRIVVSLSQERMVAFEGDQPFVDTLVTTGGPELPTPIGTYHIISKFSPFTFKSPWPKGSPYWYADAPTSFAMLFEGSGYFLHDAPWRSWFGPGSNAVDGRPGGDGTGTHGCVNVPYSIQAKLFPWTDVGTPVVIQNDPIR